MGKSTVSALISVIEDIGDSISEVVLTLPSVYARAGGDLERALSLLNDTGAASIVLRRHWTHNCTGKATCDHCRTEGINAALRMWDLAQRFPGIHWRLCGIEIESLAVVRAKNAQISVIIGRFSNNEDPGGPLYSGISYDGMLDSVSEAVLSRVTQAMTCSLPLDEDLFDRLTELPASISQTIFTKEDILQIGNVHRGRTWKEICETDYGYVKYLVDKGVVAFIGSDNAQ